MYEADSELLKGLHSGGRSEFCPNKWSLIWGLVYALSYDEGHATSDASTTIARLRLPYSSQLVSVENGAQTLWLSK